jgi:AcrR family transcriptional regulator
MSNVKIDMREQRILDAAAELFVRYGYDKTTVSDIARAAGISKGAIYLHFKSKEELLERLFSREMKLYAAKWIDLVETDPKGGTIGGMYKNMLYALSSSAFMAAMFRQDERVLGTYLRRPDNFFQKPAERPSNRYEFVKMMQKAGAIRQDMDARVIAYIMNLLLYGLVAMGDIVPKEEIPPTDDIIEGIADIMERALMPEDGPDGEAGKAVLHQFTEAARRRHEAGQNGKSE